MKEIAVPRNIEPSICRTVELGSSLAIAVENLTIRRGRDDVRMEALLGYLIYIGEQILSNGLIHVMQTVN